MRFLLRFAGTPIGRVELDDGEPAGGYLEPLPAYERVREPFRRVGELRWACFLRSSGGIVPGYAHGIVPGYGIDDPYVTVAPGVRRAYRDLQALRRQLAEAEAGVRGAYRLPELATESGDVIAMASLELADGDLGGEPPFVLVYFGVRPSGAGAGLAPTHRTDGGSSPAA